MALLKKTTITLFIILLSAQLYSQESEDFIEAFSKSYEYETNGNYTKAIESLKNVYMHSSYEMNLRLGWLSYMGGFFTESLAYYQKAIDLKPLSIEAKLGYVYPASAMGNWEQVKTKYNEILKIDPQNTTANYRLGSIYYGNEDYTTALKYFEKVVNLYPFDYSSLLMYAWTNLMLGKTREAEVLFNKVLLYKPGDESALDGLDRIE